MKYIYIPTRIKRVLMRFDVHCNRKWYIVEIVGGGMAIHSIGKTIFGVTHIEGITLGASEEVDEVAGGASAMGVDKIGEVGDMASEGQAAGVYVAGFTAGSLAR